ncbi:MAG TPA: hypothetical protein VFU60_06385 [Ktedonobacterales bacterium]|nr:hypothetical protein [Ktedonobacterales bacterium]
MRSIPSWRSWLRVWRPALGSALALGALVAGVTGVTGVTSAGSFTVYARQGAMPPQFVDPSTGAVNPAILSETQDT